MARLGNSPSDGALDPARWLAWCSFCYVGNLTGCPAVSLPLGTSSAGLPIGIQLMGRWRQPSSSRSPPLGRRLRQLHERSGRTPHHGG
jgi:hypothetical protein